MESSLVIEHFMRDYGMLSIFLIVALEYANAPLPSEVVLPLSGVMAVKYDMNLGAIIFVSIVGAIAGSLLNYYLGYKFGNPLLYRIKARYPSTKRAISESNRWMEKYDKVSVMLSRLVPLVRTVISIVAGVTHMNVFVFVLYSSIGIAVWNASLIILGYVVGGNLSLIAVILKKYTIFVGIILCILAMAFAVMHFRKKNKKDEQDTEIEK